MERAVRESAWMRLQALAVYAADIDSGGLSAQLSALARFVKAEDAVLIEWVRTMLEEQRGTTATEDHERILGDALAVVRGLPASLGGDRVVVAAL